MTLMEQRVQAAEHLCQQTLANCQGTVSVANGSSGGSGGVVGSAGAVRINSEAVEKCVGNVVKLAKAVITDDSRYFLAVSCRSLSTTPYSSDSDSAGNALLSLSKLWGTPVYLCYPPSPSLRVVVVMWTEICINLSVSLFWWCGLDRETCLYRCTRVVYGTGASLPHATHAQQGVK